MNQTPSEAVSKLFTDVGTDAAPVAVAWGDGIGPEIMDATLKILDAAGAKLDVRPVEVGLSVYEKGQSAGIGPEAWDVIRDTRVMLKAPITTPQGGGVKSLNVTLRKTLGLYANVRPVVSMHPFVPCRFPSMDVLIVRENEEDLYAGIEHRQTAEVTQCLKLITRPGTERICHAAFALARQEGRKRVTCMVKDNIMKITDGLFRKVFEEVAEEYPDIEADWKIIDIGTALLADQPDRFDVVVSPNLYGDILSDVVAQIGGSVGLAGSANLGQGVAMFEAVHGSAPDIAGKGIANPSGLLNGAVMMLGYLGQGEAAARVRNAWLRTLEDGVHTGDIPDGIHRKRVVGTQEFADEVIARLGEKPQTLKSVQPPSAPELKAPPAGPRPTKELVGVDVFADWDHDGAQPADRDPELLAAKLRESSADGIDLVMITNRGVKVWPNGMPETFKTDHWRCRFQKQGGAPVSRREVVDLLGRLVDSGVDVIKTENLYTFDGKLGFSLGQGQ